MIRFQFGIITLLAAGITPQLEAATSGYTATDIVETRKIVDHVPGAPTSVIFSPARKAFLVVTRQGHVKEDETAMEIRVFNTDVVEDGVRTHQPMVAPLRTITFKNRTTEPPIMAPHWLDDDTILFLVCDSMTRSYFAPYHLYRLEVTSGALTRVVDGNGTRRLRVSTGAYCFRETKSAGEPASRSDYPAQSMESDQFLNIVIGGPRNAGRARFVLYGGTDTQEPWPITTPFDAYEDARLAFWLSPDGRGLVLRLPESVNLFPGDLPIMTPPKQLSRAGGYYLYWINLHTHEHRRLTDRGNYRARISNDLPEVAWSKDGMHVVIADTAWPTGVEAAPGEPRLVIADYDLRGNISAQLVTQYIPNVESETEMDYLNVTIEWAPNMDAIRVTRGAGNPYSKGIYHKIGEEIFGRQTGKWEQEEASGFQLHPSAETTHSESLKVEIRESAVTPQSLVAVLAGQQTTLISAEERERMPVPTETFEWTDGMGRTFRGGLILPANWDHVTRLPLVIQLLHWWYPDKFLPSGMDNIGVFAAQPLATRGVAVLQFDNDFDSRLIPFDENEGPTTVRALDAAVEALNKRGIVDRARVGLVGHSRTAYRVVYAVSHPLTVAYAAAVANDGVNFSYLQYLIAGLQRSTAMKETTERHYGPDESFWENRARWMEEAPGFVLDQVRTPLFLMSNYPDDDSAQRISLDLELFAGLKINNRIVEDLVFPSGNHENFGHPQQQLASIQATADWMCFWLKGEIPSDPDRAARWAVLRKQQDEVLKTPPPPKGKWVFVPEGGEGAKPPEQKP